MYAKYMINDLYHFLSLLKDYVFTDRNHKYIVNLSHCRNNSTYTREIMKLFMEYISSKSVNGMHSSVFSEYSYWNRDREKGNVYLYPMYEYGNDNDLDIMKLPNNRVFHSTSNVFDTFDDDRRVYMTLCMADSYIDEHLTHESKENGRLSEQLLERIIHHELNDENEKIYSKIAIIRDYPNSFFQTLLRKLKNFRYGHAFSSTDTTLRRFIFSGKGKMRNEYLFDICQYERNDNVSSHMEDISTIKYKDTLWEGGNTGEHLLVDDILSVNLLYKELGIKSGDELREAASSYLGTLVQIHELFSCLSDRPELIKILYGCDKEFIYKSICATTTIDNLDYQFKKAYEYKYGREPNVRFSEITGS